jgi:hypothetical protein
MRALPRLSPRPTAVAQPCPMPAAPLAPVRAEAGRAVLIGACMAALGRTHHGGLRIESKSGQLRRYLSALHCRRRGQARGRCARPGPCANEARFKGRARVGSAALDSSKAASRAAVSACRGTRTAAFLRCHRSAPHRSDGSRGSTQRGKATQVRQAGDSSTTCAASGMVALGSGPRTSSAESARARKPQWTKARSKTRRTLGSRSMNSTNGSTRTP